MRRTIIMENDDAYYGGKRIDYIVHSIRSHFKLSNSRGYKYVITIVEGTAYRIVDDRAGDYEVRKGSSKDNEWVIGRICIKHFKKLFFKPDYRKRYDITVEKVKIRQKKL